MKVILQIILIANYYVLRITSMIGNSDELRKYRKTKYENKRLTN